MYHSQQLRVTLRQNWLSSTNPFNIRKLRHERRKYDASKLHLKTLYVKYKFHKGDSSRTLKLPLGFSRLVIYQKGIIINLEIRAAVAEVAMIEKLALP